MMQSRIELHIEELLLHDFPECDHKQLMVSAELELTRICSENGVPPQLLAGGVAPAPALSATLHMRSGEKPEALGVQVARAVYRGLNGAAQPMDKQPV